ncbi:MAG: hypothetical protein CL760_02725 [Chloroflexi bacterium]|nr:hypothetical protein [Chloroflexota bacterium]MQG05070.1 dihydrodipicolinate synthase family protein [SAR202 cluster bacterium]|tara:strand:- start:761 stop:1681 length:921 start_codon:yes stop_codon:yes gene_type:complete
MITVEEAKKKFRGICVPVLTVIQEDGSVDIDGIQSNIEWMLDQGAKEGNTILLACGSGGDFTVLNTFERKAIIKAIAEVSRRRVPVMASVQSTDIRETIELCQLCEDVGIDLVQMSGHYYYTVVPDDVIAWIEEVSKHTNVGFAIYNHFYSGSKYDMSVDVAERLIEIPNSVAAKWGSGDRSNLIQGFKRLIPKVAVINNGGLQAYAHMLGCKSYISHIPNFYPQQDWKVYELLEQGKYTEAEKVFDDFMIPYTRIRNSINTAGEGVFVRPFMEAAGLKAGISRLPSRDVVVTPEIHTAIRSLLKN